MVIPPGVVAEAPVLVAVAEALAGAGASEAQAMLQSFCTDTAEATVRPAQTDKHAQRFNVSTNGFDIC